MPYRHEVLGTHCRVCSTYHFGDPSKPCKSCNERFALAQEPEWMRRRRAFGLPAKDYTSR